MPPPDPFGLAGQRVDGLYHVERAIGEGGSSVVYRGMHLGLGEPIAIKCLKLTTTLDSQSIETFTRRFRDEGRLLYRLGQGNLDIVRCIASGTTVSTTTGALVPYTVLEWLEGRSVSLDFRARRQKGFGGRALEEVIAMFDPGVMAVDYAHRQGVVHRDIKPGNLYLQARGGGLRMKVLDFGLAKILDETIGITLAATAGSFMMCSPRYAAPEQFNPQMGPVGPWTDVYSLAMVLLEALRDLPVRKSEGMVACMAEALDVRADLSATALGLRGLPVHVERALVRALSFETNKRFATAGELWSEVRRGTRASERPPTSLPGSEGPPSFGDTVMDPPRMAADLLGGTLAMENAPRNMTPGGMQAVSSSLIAAAQAQAAQAAAHARGQGQSQAPQPPVHPGPHVPAAMGAATPVRQSWSGPPASPHQGSGSMPAAQWSAAPPSPMAIRQPPPGAPGAAPWSPPAQQAPAPRRSNAAPVIVLLLLLAGGMAAGGFFGWRYWQARHLVQSVP